MKNDFGTCCLCGAVGKLSFEHVPPHKAFNNRPVVYQKFEEMINKYSNWTNGKVHQRGMGAYTLCEQCNNVTGSWYGAAFVDWAWQGMSLTLPFHETPLFYLNFHIFPLRVIKQIICMFCSTNGSQWATDDIRRFLLRKETLFLPDGWRIYAFYNRSSRMRQTGLVARAFFPTNEINVYSEITFPPFGFVLTKADIPPDKRLQDISYFSRFPYSAWRTIPLKLPLLPISTWIPADYRSAEQVQMDIEKNKRMATANDILRGSD